jgi:hypothetical protein
LLAALLGTLATAPGCSGKTAASPTSTAGTANDCSAKAKPAFDRAEAAVRAHLECNVDQDCVSLAFATTCFDACSRAVSAAGLEQVKAELAATDARECQAFEAAGCTVMPPPCVPPSAPVCRQGRCE